MNIPRLLTRCAPFAVFALAALAFLPAPVVATDNHDDGDGTLCNGNPGDYYVSSHYYTVPGDGAAPHASPPANLPAGSAITVHFDVSPCAVGAAAQPSVPQGFKLSFVSYDATTDLNLDDQTVFDSDSLTLSQQGGGYALTVDIPSCSYQLDFVYGDVITDLDPATYHGQDRYISGASQSRPCPPEDSVTITEPSVPVADVGDNVTDHAHVQAADNEGNVQGSVAFYVCDEGVVPCTSGGTLLGSVALDGDYNATSLPFQPKEPGTYCFRGEFSGNALYKSSTDASQSECFTVKGEVPFFPTTSGLALGIAGSFAAAALVLSRRK